MIKAVHTMLFTREAAATRRFLREVLKLHHVDAGGGWLIFALPPAEMGVHPVEGADKPHHQIYLMCDDIERTIDDLKKKGVKFKGGIQNQGWGVLATMVMPGGEEMPLYEPRHPSPVMKLKSRAAAKKKRPSKARASSKR